MEGGGDDVGGGDDSVDESYSEGNIAPDEVWADNQMTPLCTHCDRKWDACHFCRGQQWCVPAPHPSALHVYFRRETPRTDGEQ